MNFGFENCSDTDQWSNADRSYNDYLDGKSGANYRTLLKSTCGAHRPASFKDFKRLVCEAVSK